MTPWRKPETTPTFWSDFSLLEIYRKCSHSVFIWCFQNKTENVLTYKLKLRRVQLTIIAVEIIKHYIFCVCVGGGLFIQHAIRVRHIFICALSGSATFVHIIQSTSRFSGQSYGTQNVWFDFLYNLPWYISHSKKNSARYSYKCKNVFIQSTRYSCKLLMKLEFSRQVF